MPGSGSGAWAPARTAPLSEGDQQLAAADLSTTLTLDLGLFAAACLLWRVLNWAGLVPPHGSDRSQELESTVARNYISFLMSCRDLFFTLTFVSAAFTVPRWGPSPISAGMVGGGPLSTTARGASDPVGLSILCLETLMRGVIAIVFIERLSRRIQKPMLRKKELDVLNRTVWLSGLPTNDRRTGEPLLFDDAGFARVAEDLASAMNQHIKQNTLGMFTSATMHVQVVPVINRWSTVSHNLRAAHERKAALFALTNVHRTGLWGRYCSWKYTQRLEKCKLEEARLQEELQAIVHGPKLLSGSAFVTFSKYEHRDIFLKNQPRCWELRSHTYFSFGRPPFASVTLACTRAAHPSDVNWQNLHATHFEQGVRAVALTLLLFVAMVLLTTPITISTEVGTIVPVMKRHFFAIAERLHTHRLVTWHATKLWNSVVKQLPAYFLVAVNTLVLPECIYRVGQGVRFHRLSLGEVVQLHLNYVFLILNTMLIPFLGLTSIAAMVDWAQDTMAVPVTQVVPFFVHRILHTHGIFALRYIVSSACLTNASSMMQIPQYLCRAFARKAAITLREHVEAEQPWRFAWGYWYAWTLSMFTISLCLSSVIPGTLPCAALLFTIQHVVDRHNLTYGIYLHGTLECENQFVIRALHYLRCIVATWWMIMGISFFLSAHEQHACGEWNIGVPFWCVEAVGVLLVVLSLLLVVYSSITEKVLLHESNFHTVDLSQSTILLGSTRLFQWAFRHIDSVHRCFDYHKVRRELASEMSASEWHSDQEERVSRRTFTEGSSLLGFQSAAPTLLTDCPGAKRQDSVSSHPADGPGKPWKNEALSWQAEVAVLSSYLQRREHYDDSDPL